MIIYMQLLLQRNSLPSATLLASLEKAHRIAVQVDQPDFKSASLWTNKTVGHSTKKRQEYYDGRPNLSLCKALENRLNRDNKAMHK